MNIQGDAVGPRQNQVGVPQLPSPLPALGPRCLRRIQCSIVGQTARNQKSYGQVESALVCSTVLFSCHLAPPLLRLFVTLSSHAMRSLAMTSFDHLHPVVDGLTTHGVPLGSFGATHPRTDRQGTQRCNF